MKRHHFFRSPLLIAGLFFCLQISAQKLYTDKVSGYSVKVPEGWTQESHATGDPSFHSSNPDGTATFDVDLRKLDEGISAKEYMEYLESSMSDAGFSENTIAPENREIDGDKAAYYGADDIYCGTYTQQKKGVKIQQTIFVYRKGNSGYMTVQTCPADKAADLQPFFVVFNNSFKLLN